MPDISVVIPAYEEAENLKAVIPGIKKAFEGTGRTFEIIVADKLEGSQDTEAVCKSEGCVYLRRTGGNSFGDAMRTGIRAAAGRSILTMDADGSHTPKTITEMLKYTDGFDVVAASRYVKGGDTENPRSLVFMSWALNLSYSLILGLDCRDVSNNYKLYKAELLKPLDLKCNNFDIVEEILYRIKRNKPDLKIKEVPFVFKKRLFGKTKRDLFVFMLSYVFSLVKLRLSK